MQVGPPHFELAFQLVFVGSCGNVVEEGFVEVGGIGCCCCAASGCQWWACGKSSATTATWCSTLSQVLLLLLEAGGCGGHRFERWLGEMISALTGS